MYLCVYIYTCVGCQKVAHMCVGCQEVVCILPHGVARIFPYPTHSHTLQVAQMCVGCQKVECILPHGSHVYSHTLHIAKCCD